MKLKEAIEVMQMELPLVKNMVKGLQSLHIAKKAKIISNINTLLR